MIDGSSATGHRDPSVVVVARTFGHGFGANRHDDCDCHGCIRALLATVVSCALTPARWWARRLRKHVETVNAIDADMYPARWPSSFDLAAWHFGVSD